METFTASKHARDVVDAHEQKYSHSCAPSLVEMLLKISGAVGIKYYAEQERDKNDPVGIQNVKDKTIHNRAFRKFDALSERSSGNAPASEWYHTRLVV